MIYRSQHAVGRKNDIQLADTIVLISCRFYIFIDFYHFHFQENWAFGRNSWFSRKAVPRLQRGVHAVCDFPTTLDTWQSDYNEMCPRLQAQRGGLGFLLQSVWAAGQCWMTRHQDICRLQAEPGLSSALEVQETSIFYTLSWSFVKVWGQMKIKRFTEYFSFFLMLGHRVTPNRCFVTKSSHHLVMKRKTATCHPVLKGRRQQSVKL